MQTDAVIREKYEWSNIWWDCADDATLDRILLIGDSISVGYTPEVIGRMRGIAHVDRLANSRGINDPALFKEIGYLLAENRYAAVHFNNGLHGVHIPDEVYASCLSHTVQLLKQYARGAALVWASSTPVTLPATSSALDSEKNALVLRRNARAAQIMRSYDIPLDDLYAVVVSRPELGSGDGYHYSPEGYVALGTAVAESIRGALATQRAG